MSANRDDVVSKFVRMKIRDWRDGGRELQDLARAAGFAKSTPSQVLLGTGVGAKTGPRFAKAFGYPSYDAMRAEAWEWWKSQAPTGAEASPAMTEAMTEAVEMVVSLGQGTRAQCDTIIAAFSHQRFRERDRGWWLQTLLTELDRDRTTLREDKQQREAIYAEQREVRQVQETKKSAASKQPRVSSKRGAA